MELTRIELVTTQCHCVVIPLHHSPKFAESEFDPVLHVIPSGKTGPIAFQVINVYSKVLFH